MVPVRNAVLILLSQPWRVLARLALSPSRSLLRALRNSGDRAGSSFWETAAAGRHRSRQVADWAFDCSSIIRDVPARSVPPAQPRLSGGAVGRPCRVARVSADVLAVRVP